LSCSDYRARWSRTRRCSNEVHRAAGHVAWLGEVVGQLERRQVVHGITRTVQLPDGSRTVEAVNWRACGDVFRGGSDA
jgi:hypothetical protein